MSTGTLYPILHGLERKGCLHSQVERQWALSGELVEGVPTARVKDPE